MPRRTLKDVEKLQAGSLGYVLLRASQRWGDRAIAMVNREAQALGREQPPLREAHTRLLPHLQTPGGIRITELARRVGVTKQAVQPLVAELAAQGLVRLEADPADARARRAVLTEFGLEALTHGTGVLLHIESLVAPGLGKREAAQLKKLLKKLVAELEALDARDPL